MPDIREIPLWITVLSQVLACFLYVNVNPKRKSIYFLTLSTGAFGLFNTGLLVLTKNANPDYTWLYLLAALILQYSYFLLICPISPLSNAYCALRAFILGEFAAAVEWLVYIWLVKVLNYHSVILELTCLFIIFSIIYSGMFFLERQVRYDYHAMPIRWIDFMYTFALAFAGFKLGNSVHGLAALSQTESFALYNTRALVAFGTLAMLYAIHALRKEMHMQHEMVALEYTFKNQYEQYQHFKAINEIVNIKYHDMKQQIGVLKQELGSQRAYEALDQLERGIKNFEIQTDTGNEVVDTLLNEKKEICLKHHITFSCVADGSLIAFMNLMDTCSLLGNALDNAIECELKITDPKHRLIKMIITQQKSFVLIKIENYCEAPVLMASNQEVTTKKDKRFHGYGLKSIKSIAQKYGGVAVTQYDHNWFELKVLMPLQKD